jgi:hypothetical protein
MNAPPTPPLAASTPRIDEANHDLGEMDERDLIEDHSAA